MYLTSLGVPGGRKKGLVVLGAGATRGASFAGDQAKVLPPLDADFFQQLSRMPPDNNTRRLLRFVRDEFGSEVGLSMESFFSEVDYTNRFHRDLKVDPGPHVRRYETALDDFMRVLPRVFNESIRHRSCLWHAQLARALHTGDCVLSYNYDCVMDLAMRRNAGIKWDPDRHGYGFSVVRGGKSWRGEGRGRPPKTSIGLLKMHGSMNWQVSRQGAVSLVRDLDGVTSLKGAIIPPTWFKDLQQEPFASIWKAARRQIRAAKIMVVVGYSVPPTDLFSRSLFKVEAGSKEGRQRLELVVLVNPDREARRRFFELVKGGVEPGAIVLEFSKLEELAQVLSNNMPPRRRASAA
jgi:hypothetical protein